MPNCFTCGEESGLSGNSRPRKFCSKVCRAEWRSGYSKGVTQMSAVMPHKDKERLDKAMVRARQGDREAQSYLRREHGVRALWDSESKTVRRW